MNNLIKAQIANYLGVCHAMPSPKKYKVDSPTHEPTEAEIEIFTEAENAWNEYSNSSHGTSHLDAIKEVKDIRYLKDMVHGIFNSPEFEELKNKLDTLDIPDGSFSMAIYFELELVLGFGVSLGIGLGLGASKDVAISEFLSVGILEGVAEEVVIGAQFGIWTSPPSDLGGFSLSTAIEVGMGPDVEVAIAYTRSSGFLGFAMSVACGEGVGLYEGESYTYVLGTAAENQAIFDKFFNRPAYQPRKKNFLMIDWINCKHPQNESDDNNEIYFTFQVDNDDTIYHYPTYNYYSMEKNDRWYCSRSIWFDEKVTIKIYDHDDLSSDDQVGKYHINLGQLEEFGIEYKFNSSHNYSEGSDKVEFTVGVRLLAKELVPIA